MRNIFTHQGREMGIALGFKLKVKPKRVESDSVDRKEPGERRVWGSDR